MTEIQEKRCSDILQHYGATAQRQQLIEECAELIQAVCKLERARTNAGKYDTAQYNFIEELADVEIMLEQMKQTLTRTERDTMLRIENSKINRQLQRIEKGE